MQDIAFYILSALTLLCGLMVVTRRDPIASALSLVMCIICMAGLFVLLEAFFLGAVQILVYAGAVMVLFLFVIMLLDLKEQQKRRIKAGAAVVAIAAVGSVCALLVRAILKTAPGEGLAAPAAQGLPKPLGNLLFTQYILPFEILSVLLLVAMVGAILLSKKDLK